MTSFADIGAPEPHVRQLLGILVRRRRWVLVSIALGAAFAVVVGLALPPRYTAKAQIVFEPQAAYSAGDKPILSQQDEEALFWTHITALTSRPYLKRVMDRLAREPGLAARRGSEAERSGWIRQAIRTARNWAAGAGHTSAATAAAGLQERRLDRFAASVNVSQERNSRVIAVTVTSASPEEAANAANAVAQLYLEDETRRKRKQAGRDIAWLNARIPEIQASLERTEVSREATAAEQIYRGLLQRREQLRSQQAAMFPELRILSLAFPPDRPSSFNPLLFILPSIIVFCVGGCFLAIVADRLDQGLHTAEDVHNVLGISCLGLVPLIRDRREARPHEYLLENPFSAYTEAIRSIVTSLQLASPPDAPKLILISSSLAGEGKTTLAASLAVYSAMIGRRTLLIDLDLRNPTISRELGGHVGGAGLDVLRLGTRSPAEAVRHVAGLGIDYLLVHCRPGEPLLPFVGGHVPRLLQELRDGYDCIIIDGPPLLAVAEARLLAAMADKVLLTVKWSATRRNVARETITMLRDRAAFDPKAGSIGAVLTQVDLHKHTQYRYGGWESARAISRPAAFAASLPLPRACAPAASHSASSLNSGPPDLVRPAIDAPPPASVEQPAEDNSSLRLLRRLIDEFHRLNLSYCYWKSSNRLDMAMSGQSDLDLLVAAADQHRAQAVLLESGFKLFPDVAHRLDPAVSSYLGFDEPSGRIVHLHLHLRLVAGEPLLKNYRLPWERGVLQRAVMHPARSVRILDPESEALLLAVRGVLEWSPFDPVALRQRAAVREKFERDRQSLAARVDRAALRLRACEIFADDLADMVADAVLLPRPGRVRRRFCRRLRRELAVHRVYNTVEARSRSLLRAVLWAAGNVNRRILHLPRPSHRRSPGGGRVVAVVGVDGSGKSTVVAALRHWLGAEVDVMPAYFGTGDGRPSLLLLPFKMLVPLVTRLIGTKPRGATHGRVSDRAPGATYSLLMMVWAAAVAAEKRLKLRAAHRAAGRGVVVIADRYPQDEDPGYSDGPLLPRLARVPRWLRLFEARSYAAANRLPPDLVLQLDVTPQTAELREPDMRPAAVRQRIEALRRLSFHGTRIVRISAEQPFTDEIRQIKREIWDLL